MCMKTTLSKSIGYTLICLGTSLLVLSGIMTIEALYVYGFIDYDPLKIIGISVGIIMVIIAGFNLLRFGLKSLHKSAPPVVSC